VYTNLAGQPVIILNSAEAASALFDDRGSIYSHRPHSHFANDLVGWRDLLLMQRDGPRMREGRRLFAQVMGSKAVLEDHLPLVESETHRFIRRVLDEDGDRRDALLPDHIRK
jgi:cytochrome P450